MFELGRVVATRNAVNSGVDLLRLVSRHANGDWGELDAEDRRANYQALQLGNRLLSKYTVGKYSFYVITEHDRSLTTVMLVVDY